MSDRPEFGYHLAKPDNARWAATVNSLLFPVLSMPKAPDTFAVDLSAWSLGDTSLILLHSDAIRYRREQCHVRAEGKDYLLVTFNIDTQLHFEQDGIRRTCNPGEFLIERSAEPYDFQQTCAGETWTLKVPMQAVKQRLRSVHSFAPYVYQAHCGPGSLLLGFLRTVPHGLAGASRQTAADIGRVAADLLLLALEGDARVLGSHQGSVRKAHLARIEHYIRHHLADRDLDPAAIAAANAISPRYLHKLFHECGRSVARWIIDQRLEACERDLQRPARGQTIAEVCYRWGFSDAAHFSRLFKARFGASPKEHRSRFGA
jgi:AraC-like DNA-binding protein